MEVWFNYFWIDTEKVHVTNTEDTSPCDSELIYED